MKPARPVPDRGSAVLVGHSIDFVDEQPTTGEFRTLDGAIARAARVSYQKGTKSVSDDAGLIDYLMRHRHTSPFEMVEFKFQIEAPLFVVQQLLRHRTASVNQESARYSILEDRVYKPELRLQHESNKQASQDVLLDDEDEFGAAALQDLTAYAHEQAFAAYQAMLDAGVAREVARSVLPHGTYTKLVWKVDLHNLLHFLKLRLDPHAQAEIRDLAQQMYEQIQPYVPLTLASWENHVLLATTFSADEMNVLREALKDNTQLRSDIANAGLSKSRQREFLQKLAA